MGIDASTLRDGAAKLKITPTISSPKTPPIKIKDIAIENMGYVKIQTKQSELKADLRCMDLASYRGVVYFMSLMHPTPM